MSISTALFRPSSGYSESKPPNATPILVVDDNASKRAALRAVLAPLGYLVVEADSGAAALRCIMAQDFALILLDVRMPIMDGYETAALIRLRAESELTPIIFVTAHTVDELTADRYSAGAVDFITAPADPDELRAKVAVLARLFLRAQANARKARELQVTADQLRQLTEGAPIGIFQTDTDNRYVYTNARWAEITGIPRAMSVGAPWHVMVDAAQRAQTHAEFGRREDGAGFSSRLRIRTLHGSPRIAVMTARPMLDDEGRAAGWLGTLSDVTAEIEAEVALVEARDHATEALRHKSDFMANMSHEIRTPLTGIIGWTELLMESDLDVEQRDLASAVSKSGVTLLKVTDAILDFAKIESGSLTVESVDLDVRRVVSDVTDLFAPTVRAKGLKLTVVLEDSVPSVVNGDPERLHQILSNLIGNAVKFTPAGAIDVRVTADPTRGPDVVVLFEVADSGIGIAADKLAMVFEPFIQADSSNTRMHGGTGLGLTISSRLARLMGGQIGVTSEVGVGSTFWFTVRVAPQQANVVARVPSDHLLRQ